MRYALIALVLTFTGCAESRVFEQEQPITAQLAPAPCGANDCGKPAEWVHQ